MATPVRLQRQGLGTQMLCAIRPLVSGFDIAALSPSEPDFYVLLGWQMWRGALFCLRDGVRAETPGEDVMIHRLPKTPRALDLQDELETDWRPGDVW